MVLAGRQAGGRGVEQGPGVKGYYTVEAPISPSCCFKLLSEYPDFLLDYAHSSFQIACVKPLWVMFVNSDCFRDATKLSGDLREPPIEGSARSVQSPWLMSLLSDINAIDAVYYIDSHCA